MDNSFYGQFIDKLPPEYANLFAALPDLLFILDADGFFIDCNTNEDDLLMPKELFLGKNIFDILPKSVAVQARTGIDTALNGEAAKPFEYQMRVKKGSGFYECKMSAFDKTKVIALIRNITEHKAAQEELKKTRGKLLQAQEFAHLGYWEYNISCGETSWSDELFRILGYSPQEFAPTFENFIDIVHPNDIQIVLNAMNAYPQRKNTGLDLRIKKADNQIIWIYEKIGYEYDDTGKLAKMHGIVQDITQRKLDEDKLRESEERFREIAETIDEVFWVRENGKVTYISPAFEKIWGRPVSGILSGDYCFLDSVHPEDRDEIEKSYFQEITGLNHISTQQYRIIRPDGNVRWIISKSYPVFDDKGNFIRSIGIAQDFTRIRESEELLKKAKEQAENASRAKSQFLANMSHELRTPMNGITGMAQFLKMTALTAEQSSMVDIIKSSSDLLLQIINDILDLSKIDAGKVELRPECINISDLVSEKMVLFAAMAKNKGLDLKVFIDNEVPAKIIADETRLIQIIGNLTGNAVKFTEKGCISVSLKKIKYIGSKVKLMFSVTDTGIGIRKEEVPRLFNYFTQLDDSYTKRFQGTGLGLAISKNLAELMGGKIGVESEYGKGSTFYFTCIADTPHQNQDTPI